MKGKLEQKAELANLNETELDKYEKSLKVYRDLKNVIDTAFDEGRLEGIVEGRLEGIVEGRLEGIVEGKIETAKQLKKMGVDIAIIKASTGLNEEQIRQL